MQRPGRGHGDALKKAAFAAALLALWPALSRAALVGDFTPVPVPDDWKIFKSLAPADGVIWGTGTSGSDSRATVFRIDLSGGASAAYPLGEAFGSNPIALAIVAGTDGAAWFIGAQLGPGQLAVPHGGAFLGQVGPDGTISETALMATAFDNNLYPSMAFDPASGTVVWTQIDGQAPSVGARTAQGNIVAVDFGAPGTPTSIALGADGDFYFADTFLTGIRIGRLAPNGTSSFLGEVDFTPSTGPGGGVPPLIAGAPDGNVYFTVPALGEVCRMTPSGTITHFPVLDSPGEIPSLAIGQDDNVYFGKTQGGQVGRLTPSTGAVEALSLPSSYSFEASLLVASPISFAGDDAVFATSLLQAFGGPGLLRIRDAASPCPQVWERSLSIIVETHAPLFLELGIPPDKPTQPTGLPSGTRVQQNPQVFALAGSVPSPGTFTSSVTVVDAEQCPVDRFDLTIEVYSPPVRRVIPVTEPSPADVDRGP